MIKQTTGGGRPLIGILPSRINREVKTSFAYMDAVWCSGGFPIPLGYTDDEARLAEYIEAMDGFLLSGGVDIDPSYYGEEKKFDSVEVDELRDGFESKIFPHIWASGKPVLGICRGMQAMNVFLGGTLYQHIDGHRQGETPGDQRPQHLTVCETGMLAALIELKEIYVNTFHHQNVERLAQGLVADAVSDEGYIEALHAPGHKFFLGVQFHPEMYYGRPEDDHSRKIFDAFIKACKQ